MSRSAAVAPLAALVGLTVLAFSMPATAGGPQGAPSVVPSGAEPGGGIARIPAARVAAPTRTPPIMTISTPIVRSDDGGNGSGPALSANPGSPPVRLHIPTIGVNAALESLGLAADGTIQVPRDSRDAGWYDLGPAPGDVGPAVVLGHLDWYSGPAVFARLTALRPGDQVVVDRADGSQVRFLVDRLATFSVDSFPTEQVYGATPDPTLRLITCGGTFNRSQGRYLSNVVVFASEAS